MTVAVRPITPVAGPLDATVTVPGSKSITNRALVCAALAGGSSALTGALVADDTLAMADCMSALGATVSFADSGVATVEGTAGHIPVPAARLDARQSGTTARFVTAVAALGHGTFVVDGAAQLRARPMAPLVQALRSLGAVVDGESLPLTLRADGLAGGAVTVPGATSSQFASGLLLAGPATATGLRLTLTGAVVSRPYLDLTVAVMHSFGASVAGEGNEWAVAPGRYHPTAFAVEADASAAAYAFAAAAVCGGRVTVAGLGASSRQGDLAFVDVLEQMGATVRRHATSTEVMVTGPLHGVEADLRDCSDTAPTLAVVAAFASSPTRVTGIGFIRAKESDRVANVVTELRRCGVDAEEEPDGFVVRPGSFRSARVETYADHRMAMSFALIGLRVPGLEIADPGCVTKTFPDYFDLLDGLGAADG
jgi:3-phosphoshikimate 1-carboxyvinyltransferase